MATKLSRDGLDHDKRGRVVNELQHEAAVRARVSTLLSVPPIRARRTGMASPGAGSSIAKALSREAVLKVIGWTKAARSPTRQARYIGRARDSDQAAGLEPLPMENERGELISGKAAIDAEIASWRLAPDRDNLSPAARVASPEERKAMDAKVRLRRNQAVHLIYSVPSRSTSDPEKLRAAVRAGLSETFGDAGYRYVFTIHTEHSARPHAHIIAKTTSEGYSGRKPRALRIRVGEWQTLRHVLTRQAQQHGIDVVATRREDRAELRQDIVNGREPLRADRSWHQRSKTHQGRVFEKAAPAWYRAHGAAYERRRAEAAGGRSMTEPTLQTALPTPGSVRKPSFIKRLFGIGVDREPTPPPEPQAKGHGYMDNFANVRAGRAAKEAADRGDHPNLAALSGYFSRTHREPDAARASFLAMYREAPKLAVWAATNHPEAFGSTNGSKAQRLDVKILKDLPASERPTPEAWTKERDRAQRDEINDLKRATQKGRSERAAEASRRAIQISIARVARQAETAIKHDPAEAKDAAERLRALARDAATAPRESATQLRKAAQYERLEQRLREQDRAMPKGRDRDKAPGRER